jgi:drug/metabolite transporter (DMT)-like permease
MAKTVSATGDQAGRGIAILLASVTAMAFADAVVKLMSQDLTVWQIFIARSAFALLCLLALARAAGARFTPAAPKWVALRSLLLILTWLAFYASLPVLDLTLAAVAVYTNPILTALLSAALLAERVTPRQWLGVLLGFCGVAAILKPGTTSFSWVVALPLLAAAFYSCAMVLTRSKCRDEGAISLAMALHAAFIATGAIATFSLALTGPEAETSAIYPFLLSGWAPMSFRAWVLMAFLGLLSAAFFLGVARAYQIAPPQVVAVFDYGYLVSAAIWGFLFFAEKPDALTILGMVLITAAGLLVAARPGRRARG